MMLFNKMCSLSYVFLFLIGSFKLVNCNTVDQLMIQMKNITFSVDYMADIKYYMNEFEDKYLRDNNLENHVSFWLHTRENLETKQILRPFDYNSIIDSNFNPTRKTKILVHGWLNAGNASFNQMLKNSYLELYNYNIIIVDWSDLASNLIYPIARWSINHIGSYMAELLDTIAKTNGYDLKYFHLIGHSLGAHICGIVGEQVTEGKIGRITGLDPAAPLFSSDPQGRLDDTDAYFVDVIHTCGGVLGYYQPCGHVDFYPNGGRLVQPGCGFDIGICSHTRSYFYFKESISTFVGFYSQKCDSWDDFQKRKCGNNSNILILMGEGVNQSSSGNYYLSTHTSEPFALGKPKQNQTYNDSRKWSDTFYEEYKALVDKLIATKISTYGAITNSMNNVYKWFV